MCFPVVLDIAKECTTIGVLAGEIHVIEHHAAADVVGPHLSVRVDPAGIFFLRVAFVTRLQSKRSPRDHFLQFRNALVLSVQSLE